VAKIINQELYRKIMVQESTQPRNPIYQIDRESYEPAYVQLANLLRRQIADGLFRPGDQLPSEAQLCHRYGISPMTVRRSINLLADQGVLSTVQGRGTFVKALEWKAAVFSLQELHRLFSLGSGASIRLLEVRMVSADERTARKLNLQLGAPVIYIRRLVTQAEEALFYHRAYLVYDPGRPIVEAEMDVTSLQGLFSGADNTILKSGKLTIEATIMNEEEAQLLAKTLPAAAFCIEHVFSDFEDSPVSWGWFIIPSDRLHFTAQVGIKAFD
jgi:DNA-binding GntR family transcriptional regulator